MNILNFIELSDEAHNGDDVFASTCTEDVKETHLEELSKKIP